MIKDESVIFFRDPFYKNRHLQAVRHILEKCSCPAFRRPADGDRRELGRVFILDWESNSRFEGWAFLVAIFEDLWQGLLETVFIVETSLLMSNLIIKVLWKEGKTLRGLILLCLALLVAVMMVSTIVAAVYLHFYPEKQHIFEIVHKRDARDARLFPTGSAGKLGSGILHQNKQNCHCEHPARRRHQALAFKE